MALYQSINELPEEVKNSLPRRAQHIYMRVFNAVWLEYQEPEIQRRPVTRGEVAHKVARWVIINMYARDESSDEWIREHSLSAEAGIPC